MSVPFSNTHLRVPRGFGNILEGLAREVLRDQPKDIPTFAAIYFTALLKEREDSGLDPSEWCARLEDRFYNNHAFKNSPNQDISPADATLKISEKKDGLTESQTEDGTGNIEPVGITSPTNSNFDVCEDVQGTESQGKYEMDNISDKDVISMQMDPSSEVSDSRLTDMDADTEEQSVSNKVNMTGEEMNERADKVVCQSKSEPSEETSLSGLSIVDVCDEKLRKTEDGEEQTSQGISTGDEAILGSSNEENLNSSEFELTQEVSFTGLSNIDVCAEELRGTKDSEEQGTAEDGLSEGFNDQAQESSEPNIDIEGEAEAVTAEAEAQIKATEQEAAEMEQDYKSDSSDEDEEKLSKMNVSTPNQQASEIEKKPEDETDHESKDLNKKEMGEYISQQDSTKIKNKQENDDPHINDDDMEMGEKYISNTYQQDPSEIQGEAGQENEVRPVELQQEDAEKETAGTVEQLEDTDAVEYRETELKGLGKEDTVTPSQDTDQADDNPEHMSEGEIKDSMDKTYDKEECSQPQEEEDIMDIPLDDPEANKAAAKIQAGFRGHMTRKKIKPADKPEGEEEDEEVSSSGEALNGNQGDTESGGLEGVERDDTSVPEQ